ncbi:hypothetical protein KFK09_005991 [Dendrobium nobile]|uniref:Growth-regulating factor n=1 Tax=Dendrobium nobile TaxID=94219 RepID=A0A8T3C2L6_DENNO|nr:hypothetical protein KFK09_005991 [Dendrobium nobile]
MDSLFYTSSGSNDDFSSAFPSLATEPAKQRGDFESGFHSKHGRSAVGFEENDELIHLKMSETDPMLTTTRKTAPFLLWPNSYSPASNGEKMLTFSWPTPDVMAFSSCETLPYIRNSGMCYVSSNVSMNGIVPGFRGAFTPSQWMELEQQALIYKYLAAKMPVPSSLVIPIRRNLNLSGFPSFASGSYRAGTMGCSSFNLAFARNADPEPGRCRRTDGKKWRCSRDAVGDQKYCERHMNRGRHRSRKHVEGHNGHAAKAAMPTPSQSASAVSSCSSNNINRAHQQQIKSLQPCMEESSPTQFDRFLMNKGTESERAQNSQSTSIPTNLCSVATDNLFPIFKQQTSFEGTTVRADFGLTLPDSPSNPPRSSDPEKLTCMPAPEMQDQQSKSHPLLHFIDDWPKSHSEHSTITWPDVNEMHTDRTQLSISIPMGSSHYSSSSSSPKKYKLASSCNPLKEGNKRHSSWIPVSWNDPMIGGPLGEVLTNKSRITENNSMNNSSSPLNLLSDGWNSSPRLDSSPTGVLQKTCFVSLPSSTGSSPRAERHKAHEVDDLGLNVVNPWTITML